MNYCDNCDTKFTDTIMCDCEDKEYWELHDLRQEKKMKLNKRGRLVRSVLILTILIIVVQFFTTHHRVYGKCHQTIEGNTCTLIKWEKN